MTYLYKGKIVVSKKTDRIKHVNQCIPWTAQDYTEKLNIAYHNLDEITPLLKRKRKNHKMHDPLQVDVVERSYLKMNENEQRWS